MPTQLTRAISLLYKMQDADRDALYEQLLQARKRSWATALRMVAREHGCTGTPNAPRREDLQRLKDMSLEDADSIVVTWNREVSAQIERIYADNPRSNRRTYFRRLEDWNTKRERWKLPQIALQTDVTTAAYARAQFYRNNGLRGGEYVADGPPPTCKICIRIFAAGVVNQRYVDKHPFPAHIFCPHHYRKLRPERINCGEAWLG